MLRQIGLLSFLTRRPLGPTGSLVLLGSLIVSLLAGSSAPTPLYEVYQAEWGYSAITTTVVFGVYALAVLASLLVLGRISDHVGRRPVLLVALAVQVVAMVVFSTAGDVTALFAARIVQGLATGAATAAIGAAMLDIDRARGALANSVTPGIGTASGAMLSALLVRYLPEPTHLVYLALAGVFAVQALALAALPETVSRRPGALAALTPEVALPRALRTPVLIAVPVLFAVWALAGFYASLGPALLDRLVGSRSVVYGGLPVFVLAGVGAAAVYALRNVATRPVMYLGVITLAVGVAITLAAIVNGSATTFLLGSAVAGFGFGGGFQASIRLVMPLARPHERAGVLSLLYIVCYLGLGVPAVIGGVLVVHAGGLIATAREYGVAVIVLALAALAGLLATRTRVREPEYAAARDLETVGS